MRNVTVYSQMLFCGWQVPKWGIWKEGQLNAHSPSFMPQLPRTPLGIVLAL